MQRISDEVLAEDARAGDREALIALYRRYRDAIYQFVYYRVRNRPQAEDLTSEIFVRMLEGIDRYEAQTGAFQGWLYGIARHVMADFWRRSYRMEQVPLEESDALSQSKHPQPARDLSQWRQALLRALPEKYRRVLELRILQGYSVAETAQEMGVSENYVKVLQYRALKKAAQLAEVPE